MTRSYAKITIDDLWRLRRLAEEDREDLFNRKRDTGALYRRRYFATALCQGAALHYLDGTTGVKDFDVWSFYTEAPERPFPYRRRGKWDLGDPKFGVSPGFEDFMGRRVDMLRRSLVGADPSDPVWSIVSYLSTGATSFARLLAEKSVILLDPPEHLGRIIWPVSAQPSAPADAAKPRG